MSCVNARTRYQGAAPGADTNAYTLFDSTALAPNKGVSLSNLGVDRIVMNIRSNANGTLRVYRSVNNGATWEQAYGDIAVTGSTSGNTQDIYVGNMLDCKVDWVNGGSAQTTFTVDIALTDSQVKVT